MSAAAGGAAIVPFTTYSARFREASTDIYSADYAPLLDPFNPQPAAGTATTPGTLFQSILNGSEHPTATAYAVLAPQAGGAPGVETLIVPKRYLDAPGTPPTPYNNEVYAMKGDVESVDGLLSFTIVEFPQTLLHQTDQVHIPSTGSMAARLGALAQPDDTLGPFAAGDPDVFHLHTRGLVVLPAPIAALTIGRVLTPRTFYDLVEGVFAVTPAMLPACAQIRIWSIMGLTVDAADDIPTFLAQPLTVSATTGLFLKNRVALLKRDLPGLVPGGPNSLNAIAAAMGGMAASQRQSAADAAAARTAAAAPKTASDRFKGDRLTSLLKLAEVDRASLLPLVYNALADNPKKDELAVAQNRLDARAALASSFVSTAPTITTKLLEALLAPLYDGRDRDDLNTGVTPWRTMSGSRKDFIRVREIATLAHTLQQGNTSVSLSDLIDLDQLEKDGIPIPTKYRPALRTLGGFLVLLDEFLGANHRLNQEVRRSLRFAQLRDEDLEDYVDTADNPLLPSYILRWFQLELHEFFRSHRLAVDGTTVDVPDLEIIWKWLLKDNKMWYPSLPACYRPADVQAATPADDVSTLTGATDPTTDSSKTAQPGSPDPKSEHIYRAPDQELLDLAGKGWTSLAVKKDFAKDWPSCSKCKTPICLPIRTRNGCFTGCKRCHCKKLATDDRAAFVKFLEEKFVAFRKN